MLEELTEFKAEGKKRKQERREERLLLRPSAHGNEHRTVPQPGAICASVLNVAN